MNFIEERSGTPSGSFKITPEEDAAENSGPNCSTFDLTRGNTRFFRITIKTFNCNTTTILPPTYLYFKLFKWDSTRHCYLRTNQVNMNIQEYREFIRGRESIDKLLDQMLVDVGIQIAIKQEQKQQQRQQQQQPQTTTPPPPYNALVVEDAGTRVTMADLPY
jgi:hypothetical protein